MLLTLSTTQSDSYSPPTPYRFPDTPGQTLSTSRCSTGSSGWCRVQGGGNRHAATTATVRRRGPGIWDLTSIVHCTTNLDNALLAHLVRPADLAHICHPLGDSHTSLGSVVASKTASRQMWCQTVLVVAADGNGDVSTCMCVSIECTCMYVCACVRVCVSEWV